MVSILNATARAHFRNRTERRTNNALRALTNNWVDQAGKTRQVHPNPDRAAGKTELNDIITAIGTAVPAGLTEQITLGHTVKRRAADIVAYYDRPDTSNGPTEAINGRLEHPRGTALGFATSPTSRQDRYSRPAASDPDHTPKSDEPDPAVLALLVIWNRYKKIVRAADIRR